MAISEGNGEKLEEIEEETQKEGGVAGKKFIKKEEAISEIGEEEGGKKAIEIEGEGKGDCDSGEEEEEDECGWPSKKCSRKKPKKVEEKNKGQETGEKVEGEEEGVVGGKRGRKRGRRKGERVTGKKQRKKGVEGEKGKEEGGDEELKESSEKEKESGESEQGNEEKDENGAAAVERLSQKGKKKVTFVENQEEKGVENGKEGEIDGETETEEEEDNKSVSLKKKGEKKGSDMGNEEMDTEKGQENGVSVGVNSGDLLKKRLRSMERKVKYVENDEEEDGGVSRRKKGVKKCGKKTGVEEINGLETGEWEQYADLDEENGNKMCQNELKERRKMESDDGEGDSSTMSSRGGYSIRNRKTSNQGGKNKCRGENV